MPDNDEHDRPDAHPSDAAAEGSAAARKPDQPEPEASSDGDGSWTEDPQTQDPEEDRSVEAVIRRTSGA